MSIFAKLTLCVVFFIGFSILLTILSVRDQMNAFIVAQEREHFSLLGKAVEKNLETSFHGFLVDKVHLVLQTRRILRGMTENASLDLHLIEKSLPPSTDRDKLIQKLLDNNRHNPILHSEVTLLTTLGKLKTVGIPEFNVIPSIRTAKDVPLSDIIQNIPPEGVFVLLAKSKRHVKQMLLFFLPYDGEKYDAKDDKQRILISGINLALIVQQAEKIWEERVDVSKYQFDQMKFYDQGVMFIIDKNYRPLLQKGDYSPIKSHIEKIVATTKIQNPSTSTIQTHQGDFLCHSIGINAYEATFIMAAPLAVLRAPSIELVRHLILISTALLILALILAAITLYYILAPLHRLRDCIGELAALNPASEDSLNNMEQMLQKRLNLVRNDELGDLARSFAAMGQKLASNIRISMDSLASKRRIEGELAAAREIQIGILPALDQDNIDANFAVGAFLEPAREVGGDLYDYFTLANEQKVLIMGDVSGKGAPAALFMTMCVTLIRYAMHSITDPAEVMTQINALLEENNQGNMFVTLFIALYDPHTGKISYANGGHCLPYIVSANGEIRTLENLSGPLVGALPDIEFVSYTDQLQSGESCFLYTDGLTEALNHDLELYGDERLAKCLKLNAGKLPKALHEAVFQDICNFRQTEPASDDITMLTFSRL